MADRRTASGHFSSRESPLLGPQAQLHQGGAPCRQRGRAHANAQGNIQACACACACACVSASACTTVSDLLAVSEDMHARARARTDAHAHAHAALTGVYAHLHVITRMRRCSRRTRAPPRGARSPNTVAKDRVGEIHRRDWRVGEIYRRDWRVGETLPPHALPAPLEQTEQAVWTGRRVMAGQLKKRRCP